MSSFNFTVPTDKQPGGWHSAYAAVYQRLFERLFSPTASPIDYVGEIGVDGGGFTLALNDYFPSAVVRCMDINPCPASICGNDAIEHFQMDAYTEEAVREFGAGAKYSCFIEDGSHFLNHQRFFVANYPPLLTSDGIAVVEDVQDIAHFADLAKHVPAGFFGYGIDLRMHDDRYDNLLFVIQRA